MSMLWLERPVVHLFYSRGTLVDTVNSQHQPAAIDVKRERLALHSERLGARPPSPVGSLHITLAPVRS